MDEQNVYAFNEILLNIKKEVNSYSYNIMDKHEYIMLNVIRTKRQILYHSIYDITTRIQFTETDGFTVMVLRGWQGGGMGSSHLMSIEFKFCKMMSLQTV